MCNKSLGVCAIGISLTDRKLHSCVVKFTMCSYSFWFWNIGWGVLLHEIITKGIWYGNITYVRSHTYKTKKGPHLSSAALPPGPQLPCYSFIYRIAVNVAYSYRISVHYLKLFQLLVLQYWQYLLDYWNKPSLSISSFFLKCLIK